MAEKQPGGKPRPLYMTVFMWGICFVLGYAIAGWWRGRTEAPPPPAAAVPVPDGDIARFLEAVRAPDFDAMRRLGNAAFKPGAAVPDHAGRFADYETNSTPPYAVYAFFIENTPERTRRVLLTVDRSGVVDSFMAEEMKIVE